VTTPSTQLERQVVGALLLPPDAGVADKTAAAVAERSGLSEADVRAALRQLADLDPPLVHRDIDATTGDEFWIVINLDAHHAFRDL